MSSQDYPGLLLVESDPLLCELISYRLTLLGYSVRTATSAVDAMRQAASHSIDMALINLELDGLDVTQLIGDLRAVEGCEDLPVLVLTSTSNPEIVRMVHLAGANGCVVTPYDPATLEQKVEVLLSARLGVVG